MGILVWLIVRLEVETLFIFPSRVWIPPSISPSSTIPSSPTLGLVVCNGSVKPSKQSYRTGCNCLYCCSLYHFGILFLSYLFHTLPFQYTPAPPGSNTTCVIPIPLQCHVYCYIILLAIMVDCCNMHQHYGTRFFEHSATNDDH